MRNLIKSALIINSDSPFHGKICDVLISDGLIVSVSEERINDTYAKRITYPDAILSAGWFDMRMHIGEPGHEYRETLASASAAGSFGGFTHLVSSPETTPPVQTREGVHFVRSKTENLPCAILPMACLSVNLEGNMLTDMIDLYNAGALAFTDGNTPIYNSDLLFKGLQYLQHINGLLINRPEDRYLARFGQMHEGETSTMLGLKGIPSLAEELMLIRDLQLLKHAGGRLHFAGISTKESVERIREAKKEGLNVTADTSIHQLCFTDEDLIDFDTNLKSSPPFRSESDKLALLEGLADGTIDVLVSGHQPLDTESKYLEFDLASPGQVSLETFFPTAFAKTGAILGLEKLIETFTEAPRHILGLPNVVIEPGAVADLTLFSLSKSWKYEKASRKTLGINSPFFGDIFRGQALATFRGKVKWLNSDLG